SPRHLGVALKPHCRQRQLLHPPNPRTNPPRQTLYHDHCSWLLQRFLNATFVHETSLRPCWSALCCTFSTAKPWFRARRSISSKDTGCISTPTGGRPLRKLIASTPPDLTSPVSFRKARSR